jgi:hypothetical protein
MVERFLPKSASCELDWPTTARIILRELPPLLTSAKLVRKLDSGDAARAAGKDERPRTRGAMRPSRA